MGPVARKSGAGRQEEADQVGRDCVLQEKAGRGPEGRTLDRSSCWGMEEVSRGDVERVAPRWGGR